MQFFGGKAKDGKYHVATRWALEFGLGTPHKEVIESPEVQEAFSQVEGPRGRHASSWRPPPPATSPRPSGSRNGTGT